MPIPLKGFNRAVEFTTPSSFPILTCPREIVAHNDENRRCRVLHPSAAESVVLTQSHHAKKAHRPAHQTLVFSAISTIYRIVYPDRLFRQLGETLGTRVFVEKGERIAIFQTLPLYVPCEPRSMPGMMVVTVGNDPERDRGKSRISVPGETKRCENT